jgi:hypothetical protein
LRQQGIGKIKRAFLLKPTPRAAANGLHPCQSAALDWLRRKSAFILLIPHDIDPVDDSMEAQMQQQISAEFLIVADQRMPSSIASCITVTASN